MLKIPSYKIIQSYETQNSNLWNLDFINVRSFWGNSKGGGRVVALIDTGWSRLIKK